MQGLLPLVSSGLHVYRFTTTPLISPLSNFTFYNKLILKILNNLKFIACRARIYGVVVHVSWIQFTSAKIARGREHSRYSMNEQVWIYPFCQFFFLKTNLLFLCL